MSFLIDTNIILRLAQPEHPMCSEALNALSVLRQREENSYLTAQNLIEFWRTCTRPIEKNGLGMTVAESDEELRRLETIFLVLPDTPEVYGQWRRLVVTYQVMGVNVHDARLVAVMLVYGVKNILTFNTRDFSRYSEIVAVHPTSVGTSQRTPE
ncbi:MAG: type II toxin-antitoxin system VapC family toxin [Microcystis sp.]|nr:type II toxin-antitoxin system VapC family toxin [Microcystis aeruginosa LG13-12]